MKKNIFKSLGCMNQQERQELFDYYKEALDTTSEEDTWEAVNESLNLDYDADFDSNGNWYYSSLKETPVVVTGVLGLWDGKHTIQPKEFKTLPEALRACCTDCDEIEIWEDGYGNFYFEGYHHDGHNHFCIKKKTNKGLRCLHFCKEVYGL